MGRRDSGFPENAKEVLSELLDKAETKADFKRVQAVWLRVSLGLSYEQIALGVGLAVNTVRCLCSRFRTQGPAALQRGPGRGGRRKQNLSPDEEAEFLRPFMETAEQGHILHVGEVKEAYEKRLGRSVPKSTVYRLLKRHGWRKLAPRRQHPKADSAKQEVFKKNSARSWRGKSSGKGPTAAGCD